MLSQVDDKIKYLHILSGNFTSWRPDTAVHTEQLLTCLGSSFIHQWLKIIIIDSHFTVSQYMSLPSKASHKSQFHCVY